MKLNYKLRSGWKIQSVKGYTQKPKPKKIKMKNGMELSVTTSYIVTLKNKKTGVIEEIAINFEQDEALGE